MTAGHGDIRDQTDRKGTRLRISGKAWWLLLGGVLVAALAATAFGAYLMYPSMKRPGPATFPPPADQAEADRQDLAYLKAAMHSLDRSFSADEWDVFDRIVEELLAQAGKLDRASFEMEIARAVAAAKNAHTNLLGVSRGLTLNSIPLRFYWFADGLRVVKADPAYADLLGSKVLAIAGRSPDELMRSFHTYLGGSASLAREFLPFFTVSPQALRAAGLQDSGDEVTMDLETAGGVVVQRSFVAAAIPAAGLPADKSPQTVRFDPRELYWPRRELSPVALPVDAPYPRPVADARRWVHVLDGKAVPFTLQRPNEFYWSASQADGHGVYVQLNVLMDEPGREPLQAFLERTTSEASGGNLRFAVIDLRSNPGGSYLAAAEFTQKLSKALPADGKLFILTSGNTFSAAIVTAARLKYYAGSRGEIVGEPMGDAPQFWAEAADRIVLPNSGLRIGYATGYHDWENGCSLADVLVCYPLNYSQGVAAGSLDPTLPVSWSYADYIDGVDSALERIAAAIAPVQ